MAEASGWTPQRLNDTVARGEIYPLYFLYGDETFLIDEALASIEHTTIGDGMRDFNLNTFYGGETDASQIRDAVETLPMMSPVRLVVVKDAQDLSEKQWDSMMNLVDDPVSTTAFVCIASKIDKRKKHVKRFIEKGVVVEFKRPYDNQIPDWIRTLAKKHELKMTADAVSLFHQLVGSNLQDINAELGKLVQFLGGRKQASVDDVLKAVSRIRLDSVFDLTDAIGRNDRARALDCLVNLLDNGQNEVGVLALISRHVRILKLVSDGMREGLSGPRLSSRAGVSPYFLRSYVEQARAWSDRKIERTFQALLDTDRALKSSPIASHIWLENFIIQTCS
jgi:DNA polymerase III subunit delta